MQSAPAATALGKWRQRQSPEFRKIFHCGLWGSGGGPPMSEILAPRGRGGPQSVRKLDFVERKSPFEKWQHLRQSLIFEIRHLNYLNIIVPVPKFMKANTSPQILLVKRIARASEMRRELVGPRAKQAQRGYSG